MKAHDETRDPLLDQIERFLREFEEIHKLIGKCPEPTWWNFPILPVWFFSQRKRKKKLERNFAIVMQDYMAREVKGTFSTSPSGLTGERTVIKGLYGAPEKPKYTGGLDGDLNMTKNELLKGDEPVLVLTGSPGSGETTMAKELCWDPDVKAKFGENIFFVIFSKTPNLRNIVRTIFGHCRLPAPEFSSDEDAINRLSVLLRQFGGKPILLVLDDVWQGSETLVEKFKFQIPGYKVLVTSRVTFPRSTNISVNVRLRRNIVNWRKGDDLLGRGSFGSVYKGISGDGFFFAVKEVSLLDPGSRGQQSVLQLKQEIALLSQFEHENIVQYYGTEMDKSNLYIFLELVTEGSLVSLYKRFKLQDSQVSAYTRQILHGLKYLHDQNVIHRDIKCANILVDARGSVKLADFGLAKATKSNDVNSSKGTAFWMAPEVVNGENQGYGFPADIWSLGCTVLEMLTGKIPYHGREWVQALYRIAKGELPLVPESLSKEARDFILQCLQVNPDERPTATKLLTHPFVQRPLSISSGSASPYIPGRRNQLVSSH